MVEYHRKTVRSRRFSFLSLPLGLLSILILGISCVSPGKKGSPPEFTVLDRIVQQVRQNDSSIKKYFILDGEGDLLIKADIIEIQQDTGEIETFEVVYDLKGLQTEGSRLLVPFWVRALKTGAVRHDRLQWNIQEDASGILLAFDDDHQEVWERNLDLLDQYGARVTFFIQGEVCSFCTVALNRGHDVGYHSLHHLNLPTVSREVFVEETLAPADAFRDQGIPLSSFAYPFGLSEDWMHEELWKSFKVLRGYGVTFRVYDREALGKGYIISRAIDNILFKADEDFEGMIALMLRTLKFMGGDRILPLTTHTISDTADWGIKPRRLEYLLRTAHDLGLRFYRYQDFSED